MRTLATEFAARGKVVGDCVALIESKVTSPRMARYRLWRYAQSANFAFGEGRLLLAYVWERMRRSAAERKEKQTIG